MAWPEGYDAAPLPISVVSVSQEVHDKMGECFYAMLLVILIALNFYGTGALLTDEFTVVIQFDLRIRFAWLINMSPW